MTVPGDSLLRRRTIEFRMEVEPALVLVLFLFHYQRMGFGEGILPYSLDLPGNLHARPVGFDRESMVGNIAGRNSLRKLATHRQLIKKVGVDSLKPVGQLYLRIA
jgi:hypothetical protein